jgi:hypothetical protein
MIKKRLLKILLIVVMAIPFLLPTPVHADVSSFPCVPINGNKYYLTDRHYDAPEDVYFLYDYQGFYGESGDYGSVGLDEWAARYWSFHSFSISYLNSDGSIDDHYTSEFSEKLPDGRIVYWSKWDKWSASSSLDAYVLNGVPYVKTGAKYSMSDIFNEWSGSITSGHPHDAVSKASDVNLGRLKNITYEVTKKATFEECFDTICWDRKSDTNNNIFDKNYTVTINAIPAYVLGSTPEKWKSTGWNDWVLNDASVYTDTVNAVTGQVSICWADLIGKFGYGDKFWSAVVQGDTSYISHAWLYRIRLNCGTSHSDWLTVHPFVSGDKKSIDSAMSSTSYNSDTYNVLNSTGYSYTDSSSHETVNNSFETTYNYETINNYDQSKTDNSITNISHPSGSADESVIDNWFQKVIDFFNNTLVALVASAVGGISSAASGLVAKTGFLGECVAMVPQMIGLLVASVSTHVDAVLKWNDISLMGTTLISAGSVNLDDAVVQYGLADLHTICKVCMDAGILLFLNFKVYKKALEILKLR